MNKISGATRMAGFDKPTVWSVMTPLAVKTKSVNLVILHLFRVKDFPHGHPPSFTSTSFKNPPRMVALLLFSPPPIH